MELNKLKYKIRDSEFDLNYLPDHVLIPEEVVSKIQKNLGFIGKLKDVSSILNKDKDDFIPTIKGYDFDINGWKLIDKIDYGKLPESVFALQSNEEKLRSDELPQLEVINPKKNITPLLTAFATTADEILVDCQQIIIKFESELKEDQAKSIIDKFGLKIIHEYSFTKNTYKLLVPKDFSATHFIQKYELNSNKNIKYAEVCYLRSCELDGIKIADEIIEDELYKDQWHLKTIGFDGALNCVREKTKHKVKLGVIDFGFSKTNKEILPFDLTNSRSINPTLEFSDLSRIANSEHGTLCAAIALGRKNDSAGIGPGYDADLVVVQIPGVVQDKTKPDTVLCEFNVFALAIEHLISFKNPTGHFGVDVISCSIRTTYFGSNYENQDTKVSILKEVLDLCSTARGGKGLPIFWSVPNRDIDISANRGDLIYRHEQVVVVGSSDKENNRVAAGFGEDLDFIAPGINLIISDSEDNYLGSSFATAFSAGIACFILSYKNALTYKQLSKLLKDNCEPVKNETKINKIGSGIINLKNVFKMNLPSERYYHTHPVDPFVIKISEFNSPNNDLDIFHKYEIKSIGNSKYDIFYVPKNSGIKLKVGKEFIKYKIFAKESGQILELSNEKKVDFAKINLLMDLPLTAIIKIPSNKLRHFIMLEKTEDKHGELGSCIPQFYLDNEFKLISFGEKNGNFLLLFPYYVDRDLSVNLVGGVVPVTKELFEAVNSKLAKAFNGNRGNRIELVRLVQANAPKMESTEEESREEASVAEGTQPVNMSILIDGMPANSY